MIRICTICARGGSKGVPGKNLRPIHGIPLVGITVRQALATKIFDYVAVSSDDDDILSEGRNSGAHFVIKRPTEMATDTAGKIPAIQHAAQTVEMRIGKKADIVVDLDVTSPLRLPSDICGAVALLQDARCSNVITGTRARRSPYFNLVESSPSGTVALAKRSETPILRRQDAPQCFDMNASIYVWWRDVLFSQLGVFGPETHLFEMPEERSLDIDSELDFAVVSFIAEKYGRFRDEF